MEYKILDKSSHTIWFQAISETQLSKTDLEELQMKMGYIVFGYGYPTNVKMKQEKDKYIYTWECSGSCD